MPLVLAHNQLMLLALLAIGAIWAAVTAGELLELPPRPCSWSSTPRSSARSPGSGRLGSTRPRQCSARSPSRRSPPACAAAPAGVALVALGRARRVRRDQPVRRHPRPGPGQRGVHLGDHRPRARPDRVVRPHQLPRRLGPPACLPRRPGADPRADRPVRAPELRARPGRPRRPDRERGARRAAGGGADRPHPARRGPHPARRRHRGRGPGPRDQPRSSPSTAWPPATCAWSGTASPSRSTVAAGWPPSCPASCPPGSTPRRMDLPRRLSALDRKLSPATVRLDTAVLFLAFRDSATVEERRRLAREMHDGVAQEMASLGYFVDSLVEQEPEGSDRARQLRHAARAADHGRRRGTPVGPDPAHEHRRERLPGHRDRLAGPPPQREQRYPDPRHPRRVDHPPAARGRERAAAHRPGGHDQRRPALRRPGHQRPVPRRSPDRGDRGERRRPRARHRPRRLARPGDHARARRPHRGRPRRHRQRSARHDRGSHVSARSACRRPSRCPVPDTLLA